MGFKGIRHWVESAETGKTSITSFRKMVAGAATNTGDYIDYTYFSGNPVANFYASAPLEAALVELDKGLRVPQVDEQFVKQLTIMSAAASATSTTNQNQTIHMLDYLMYYPFIDTDAAGEVQTMIPSVSLPRYTDGIEKTAINYALNTDFKLGTVAGTPGTSPTNWSISNPPSGCQRTIGFGTDQYGDYLEVRFWGTNTSGSTAYLDCRSSYLLTPTTPGETWTGSAKVSLVDGAWPTAVVMQVNEGTAGGGYLGANTTSLKTSVASSTPTEIGVTLTMGKATVASTFFMPVSPSAVNNEVIDFTFRIYEPMFVKRQTPAPYVKSTTSPASITWTSKGEGVKAMAISQSAAASYGTVTFTYTNQDGIPNRQPPVGMALKVCNGGGVGLSYYGSSTASAYPFLPLATGDTGIQSIESVLISTVGGGLMSLVLVKPLMTIISGEECRRSTTGNIESYGSASQIESVIHRQPAKIVKGAVLGFIGCGNNGSLSSSILTGVLETQWS